MASVAATEPDVLQQGRFAVQLVEGLGGMAGIRAQAEQAIAERNYGAAMLAARHWMLNKPALEALAQSLDPTDAYVARAVAALAQMRAIEPRLPTRLFSLGIPDLDAKDKAAWLARVGGGPAPAAAAVPVASTGGGAPALTSPLRPENVRDDGVGWSDVMEVAIGPVGVWMIEQARQDPRPYSPERVVADLLHHAIHSPEFTAGFLTGTVLGGRAAVVDTVRAIPDMVVFLAELEAKFLLRGGLAVLDEARDQIDALIEHAPELVAALARRWTDESDPFAQGSFQGHVIGYVVVQLAIMIAAEFAGPLGEAAGPYAGLIRALKWIDNPLEGMTELARGAKLSTEARAALRGERRGADAATEGARAAKRGSHVLGDAFDDARVAGHADDAEAVSRSAPKDQRVLEPFTGPSLDSARDLAKAHPDAQVIAAEHRFPPAAEDIARFRAEGGEFLAERFAESLPPGSLSHVYVRYPIPHSKGLENIAVTDAAITRELALNPRQSRAEATLAALERQGGEGQVESMTNFGPHALEKLEPGGTLDVVYWEREVATELKTLTGRLYLDPATGRRFRLEIVDGPLSVPRTAFPNSGYGIPEHVAVVTRVVLRKVGA